MLSYLSLLYSIILFVSFSVINAGNAGAAENVFNIPVTPSGSDLIDIKRFSEISDSRELCTFFFTGGNPLALVRSGEADKSANSFSRIAAYGNHTIDRIKPISAASLSDLVGNPGLIRFDRVETKADNIRLNPVPEPASMLLVGSGLIFLAGIARKKFLKKKGY